MKERKEERKKAKTLMLIISMYVYEWMFFILQSSFLFINSTILKLRYSSHTTKLTLLNWLMQWLSVYSQSCVTLTTI
jgi:hypothetical protein